MHSDYINYLADQAAKRGLKAKIDCYGELDFEGVELLINNRDNKILSLEIARHIMELTEFYRKRLEPATTT